MIVESGTGRVCLYIDKARLTIRMASDQHEVLFEKQAFRLIDPEEPENIWVIIENAKYYWNGE